MAPRLDKLSPRAGSAYERFIEAYPTLPITSAYRDPAYNAKVGGAKGSAHMSGDAIDFSVDGLDDAQKADVVGWWRKQGAKGLGYYPRSDSVHVDLRDGPNRAWGPNYSSSSLGQTPEWFQSIAAEHRGAPSNGDTYSRPLITGDAKMAGYPSNGGIGAVGGLAGLGGYPQPEERGGIGGFFNNPKVSDVLQALGTSLMSSPSNNVLAGFSPAYDKLSERRDRKQESAADRQLWASALGAMGLPPDQAAIFAGNPQAAQMVLAQQREDRNRSQETSQVNKTAEYARAQGFDDIADAIENKMIDGKAAFQEIQRRQGLSAGNTEFGLQSVYSRDAEGNVVMGQMTKDGRYVPSQVPDGLTPLSPYDAARDKAAGSAYGKEAGTMAAGAPAAIRMADDVSQQVDGLISDPYLPNMIGPVDSRLPNWSADANRVQAKIDQIQGGAFLQARQMLKGGGQITDYEGARAEAAYVRMNQAQSVQDFTAALTDFRDAVRAGAAALARTGNRAPDGREQPPQLPAPIVIDGVKIRRVR